MKRLLFSLVVVLTTMSLSAQFDPTQYPIDTINGEAVYRYPVQKSEGMYRIGVNFGVTQDDLFRLNPQLQYSGLKLGQVILVPVKEPLDTTKFFVHTIQAKETLYGLSRLYDVRVRDIQKHNPEVSKNMPIGGKLIIPKKEKKLSILTKEKDVQPTLLPDTIVQVPNPLLVDSADKRICIAFLLPFMTDEVNRTAATERFVEFYEGALLAVYNAQQNGHKIDIYVYDTEKNDIRIQKILQEPALQQVHAIIGPAYPSQVNYVSTFAKEHQIPTIIPFTSKVNDIDKNPYLFQFNPTDEAMADTLIQYTTTTYPDAQYILVKTQPKHSARTTLLWQLELKQRKIQYEQLSDSIVLNGLLPEYLDKEKQNILFFDTERYKDIKPLMMHLQYLQEEYPIALFAHYAWQKENIPVSHLYPSIFRPKQLINVPLSTYNLRFNHFFGHELMNEAPRYDLLGHDLTVWLLQYLNQSPVITRGLQSDIHFIQTTPQGGFENTAIQIIEQ